jgi:hypothetical protein
MSRNVTALFFLVLVLAAPASAHALELGVQDAKASPEQLNGWGADVGARWQRVITTAGDPDTAQQIRDIHAAGRKVILTVGGNGTSDLHPTIKGTLRWIAQLPRADRYTWTNEPDMVGPAPCVYHRRWMQLRRVLGRALLWGDVSPITGRIFTLRAAACGRLPQPLPIAAHPYQATDPLAVGHWSFGLGSLPHAGRVLSKAGIRPQWWITEFGYGPGWQRRERIDDQRAAWLWPRALTMARRIDARVLVIYTAQGPTWDTRPGEQAWAAIRASA